MGELEPTENCFFTTYHPSLMVCLCVLAGSLWPGALYLAIISPPENGPLCEVFPEQCAVD
jgi:hypothetical protein